MKIAQDAQKAWQLACRQGLIEEQDSSVIFVCFDQLDQNLHTIDHLFGHPRPLHTVAIKTQPHIGVLKKIVALGYGLEAASFEEVQLALQAGCAPQQIVFNSPVKTRAEIAACQSYTGMWLNANSYEELQRLPKHRNYNSGLRINPLCDTGAPELFAVSGRQSKFGVDIRHRQAIVDAVFKYALTTLHVHAGSQMKNPEAAVAAVKRIVHLADDINQKQLDGSIGIRCIDIGGGLAAETLSQQEPARMRRYAQLLRQHVPQLWSDYRLITEFGQWVHANTGFVVSDIEYCLHRQNQNLIYAHLGADFFMRNAYGQPIEYQFRLLDAQGQIKNSPVETYDIAGPLCFQGDFIARDVFLPRVQAGDRLLILGTGANTYGLWSRHCSRTIPKCIAWEEHNRQVSVLSERHQPF